jgi:hypothetical protein
VNLTRKRDTNPQADAAELARLDTERAAAQREAGDAAARIAELQRLDAAGFAARKRVEQAEREAEALRARIEAEEAAARTAQDEEARRIAAAKERAYQEAREQQRAAYSVIERLTGELVAAIADGYAAAEITKEAAEQRGDVDVVQIRARAHTWISRWVGYELGLTPLRHEWRGPLTDHVG